MGLGIGGAIIGSSLIGAAGSIAGGNAQKGAARQQLQSQAAATGSMTETWENYLRSVMPIYEQAQQATQGISDQTLTASIGDLRNAERYAIDAVNAANRDSIRDLRGAERSANAFLNPYITTGRDALGRLNRGEFEADPSYQWRLQEGLDAVEASAAARGGLFSGATGQALQTRGQNEASQEYNNWFGREFNLANMGLGAANQAGANTLRTADSITGVRDRTAGRTADIRLGTAGRVADTRDRAASRQTANIWGGADSRAGVMDNFSRGMTNAWNTYAGGTANALANQGNAEASMWGGVANAASGGLNNWLNYSTYQDLISNPGQVANLPTAPSSAFGNTALALY